MCNEAKELIRQAIGLLEAPNEEIILSFLVNDGDRSKMRRMVSIIKDFNFDDDRIYSPAEVALLFHKSLDWVRYKSRGPNAIFKRVYAGGRLSCGISGASVRRALAEEKGGSPEEKSAEGEVPSAECDGHGGEK